MKKVSLFFTTPVRQQMEGNQRFAMRHGVLEAITLPTDLLRVVVGDGLNEEGAKKIGGNGAWKCFHCASSEFHEIQGAIQEAQRMESTVGFMVGKGHLNLEIKLYRRGEKVFFFEIMFTINIETGEVQLSHISHR